MWPSILKTSNCAHITGLQTWKYKKVIWVMVCDTDIQTHRAIMIRRTAFYRHNKCNIGRPVGPLFINVSWTYLTLSTIDYSQIRCKNSSKVKDCSDTGGECSLAMQHRILRPYDGYYLDENQKEKTKKRVNPRMIKQHIKWRGLRYPAENRKCVSKIEGNIKDINECNQVL